MFGCSLLHPIQREPAARMATKTTSTSEERRNERFMEIPPYSVDVNLRTDTCCNNNEPSRLCQPQKNKNDSPHSKRTAAVCNSTPFIDFRTRFELINRGLAP